MKNVKDDDDGDARPVYLVPKDILDSWKDNTTIARIDKPLDVNLSRASENVTKALKRKRPDDSDYDVNQRLIHELGQFLRYKALRDEQSREFDRGKQPQTSRDEEEEGNTPGDFYTDENILNAIPPSYRSKAKNILKYWLEDPSMSVDRKTGRLSISGSPVPGSDVIKLLNDAVSRTKRKDRPAGFDEVYRHLPKLKRLNPGTFTNPAWRYARSRAVATPRSAKRPARRKPAAMPQRLAEPDSPLAFYDTAHEEGGDSDAGESAAIKKKEPESWDDEYPDDDNKSRVLRIGDGWEDSTWDVKR